MSKGMRACGRTSTDGQRDAGDDGRTRIGIGDVAQLDDDRGHGGRGIGRQDDRSPDSPRHTNHASRVTEV